MRGAMEPSLERNRDEDRFDCRRSLQKCRKLIATAAILCSGLVSIPAPARSKDISNGERAAIEKLVSTEQHEVALRRLDTLLSTYPDSVYVNERLYKTLGHLGGTGEPKHFERCGDVAVRTMRLDPERRAWHANAAVWCYHNGQIPAKIPPLGDELLGARRVLGETAWLYAMFEVTAAFQSIGAHKRAHALLRDSVTQLLAHPEVAFFGNIAPAILETREISQAEEDQWTRDIATILRKGPNRSGAAGFRRVLALFKLCAGDRQYAKGATSAARDAYSAGLQYLSGLPGTHGGAQDHLRIRLLATEAQSFAGKTPKRRELRLFTVVISDTEILPRVSSRTGLRLKPGPSPTPQDIARLKRGFQIFSDSILALTKGELQWVWAGSLQYRGRLVVSKSMDDRVKWKRFVVSHPGNLAFLDPVPEFPTLQNVDAILIFWPGVLADGVSITNGGVRGETIGKTHAGLFRLLFIGSPAESGANRPYDASVFWFHHEFFHQVEAAYPELKFPKLPQYDHPYHQRTLWPADYDGATEWDFYLQTYRRRVLREDNLRRLRWRER